MLRGPAPVAANVDVSENVKSLVVIYGPHPTSLRRNLIRHCRIPRTTLVTQDDKPTLCGVGHMRESVHAWWSHV